jgi:hypothetical protein
MAKRCLSFRTSTINSLPSLSVAATGCLYTTPLGRATSGLGGAPKSVNVRFIHSAHGVHGYETLARAASVSILHGLI